MATLALGRLPSEMPHPFLGDGKCKHSCGRPVNPAKQGGGRKFNTCCRSCAKGSGRLGHDRECDERNNRIRKRTRSGMGQHRHQITEAAGDDLQVLQPLWKRTQRGEPIPEDAVEAGQTSADGQVWVGRFNGEPGKINAEKGNMWNFWGHHNTKQTEADILCFAGRYDWISIKRGHVIPENAVKAGATPNDGVTYVGRFNGEAGKWNVQDGQMWNYYGHYEGCRTSGELLVLESSVSVPAKAPEGLSYVAEGVWKKLSTDHADRIKTSWNVTHGTIVGSILQTPPSEYFVSEKIDSSCKETHSDYFPRKIHDIIIKGKRFVDIASLAPPDGRFLVEIKSAIEELASNATGEGLIIRLLFGNIIGMHISCVDELKKLLKDVKKDAKIQVWLGAWRRGVSWNHAKIIAVDGEHLLTGGHNLWDDHYLKNDPVRDLSIEAKGQVAKDGHMFLNEQWKYIIEKHKESFGCALARIPDWMSLVKGHRVGVSCWHAKSSAYPPMYAAQFAEGNGPPFCTPAFAKSHGQLPIISCGRHGSLDIEGTRQWTANPSDAALTAMIASAKKIVRMSLQDLGPLAIPPPVGPKAIPGCVWPKDYLRELGKAIFHRGVDVEIVLSGPNSVPGSLSPLVANYGNGWTCNDVASEIIKETYNNPILCEISWSSTWQSSMQANITSYKASSEDAARSFLTVKNVDLEDIDILGADGNVCADKCLGMTKEMFPLRVQLILHNPRLRQLIQENLRVTYLRSTCGQDDWEKAGVGGNHAKFFIVDDICYYIGSQNMYIANLAEWGIIVDDEEQTQKVISDYWQPLWRSSYQEHSADCDVDEVMRGLHINRDGIVAADCSPEDLSSAEQAMRANNCGSAPGKSLAVICKRASSLKNTDWRLVSGVSDPYVKLHLVDQCGAMVKWHEQTRTIDDCLDPIWDELIVFENLENPSEYTLKITVWHEYLFHPHDLLGEASVPLNSVENTSECQERELEINKRYNSKLFIGLLTLGEWGS